MSQNVEVVTLALYLLDGHTRPVDTEDVAVKAHELAPERFSWKKHPDQINLELVRVSLSDGKKPASGFIEGSGREGWRLTPAGTRWAGQHSKEMAEVDFSRPREDHRSGSISERRWRSEHQRLITSAAWQAWSTGQPISEADASALFRLDVYSVGRLRATKISRLVDQFSEKDDIREFLAAAEAALPDE